MRGRIYSVGYEGFTVDSLAERLATAGVTVLVDVRLNAISRRPGFSRRALEAAMREAGIEYIHERDLGNPRDNRDAFRKGDGAAGRARMRSLLKNGGGFALDRLVNLAQDARVAVMCVERDRHRCHRDVVTEMVTEQDPTIEVLQVL
ncbi:MAG: DUF488 domain-containing protein [Acidimicrobiales bacterium]